MKIYQIIVFLFLLMLGLMNSSHCQPLILKGSFFAIPGEGMIYEIGMGAEVRILPRISFDAWYQKRNETGDNEYFRNTYLLSLRYYPYFKKSFFKHVFVGPVYRYSDFIQHPDQSEISEYHYYTNSAGILAGKNIHLGKRFLLDISTGPFVYFNSNSKSIEHDTQNVLGSIMILISDQLDWRTFIKLGIKIGYVPE